MDYDWVTDEMFDTALMEILAGIPLTSLVRVEGVYELLKEEYNNEVLTKLESSEVTSDASSQS
tara:strand:+ start:213 stop:401 length:189 start_codon:yes stop_codon:yes gene_type:complete